MLEKFPEKKKKKTLDESPSTPQAKVMRRSANTGEQSSPEDVAACGKKNQKNSTKLQDARPTSFLDRLLESTIAPELSAHETQALMQCRTTAPANSAGLTVRQRMNLAKKKNGNKKNKKQEKTGDSKKKEAATGSKKTKKVKSDAGLNSNVNEKKLENQKGGEDSTADKKKKKKGRFSKKTKAPLGRRGTQEAEEVGIPTEPAEAEVPKKKRPHSHTEEDLAKMDRAKARQNCHQQGIPCSLDKELCDQNGSSDNESRRSAKAE